ncbi:MAG: hypothetical protein ABSE53_17165 [Terracidiphilus sp.]|jgi:hypothetical protein
MSGELSERKQIEREIFALRQRIHEHLTANNVGAANLLLDEISKLERELFEPEPDQKGNHENQNGETASSETNTR